RMTAHARQRPGRSVAPGAVSWSRTTARLPGSRAARRRPTPGGSTTAIGRPSGQGDRSIRSACTFVVTSTQGSEPAAASTIVRMGDGAGELHHRLLADVVAAGPDEERHGAGFDAVAQVTGVEAEPGGGDRGAETARGAGGDRRAQERHQPPLGDADGGDLVAQ